MKKSLPKVLWLSVVGALVLLSMLLYACATPATPEPTPVPTPVPPTPVPLPDQSAIWAAWENGPHNAGYDIGKGPNTMCSRCHSPQNWIPGSKPGKAPNCVTCKFPFDAELRHAPTFAEGGMDFVAEEDWVGIPCAQCHKVDENGTASEELYWLAPISLTYEKINSPNELCTKCHATPGGTKTGSVPGGSPLSADHNIILGGSAHLNYAGVWPQTHRPDYCIDCHNPHSGETKQCVDCHTDTASTHTRVAAMMDKVTCMACHDASGSAVGIAKDGGLFTTIKVTPSRTAGTPPTTAEITSHSIIYLVSCNRCHKADNPWGLTVLTAGGEVPPPPSTEAPKRP